MNAKISYNSLSGKTENEVVNTIREGKSGPVWGRPLAVIPGKDGGKIYRYRVRVDVGQTQEQCGQDMRPGVVTRYVCTYSNVFWKTWEIRFGKDGRVSEWEIVNVEHEKTQV